jgi:hypothetical protein
MTVENIVIDFEKGDEYAQVNNMTIIPPIGTKISITSCRDEDGNYLNKTPSTSNFRKVVEGIVKEIKDMTICERGCESAANLVSSTLFVTIVLE